MASPGSPGRRRPTLLTHDAINYYSRAFERIGRDLSESESAGLIDEMKRNAVYASDESAMLDALVMFDLDDVDTASIGHYDPCLLYTSPSPRD